MNDITQRPVAQSGIDAQAFVIPGEDPGQLQDLATDYYLQFQPAGPLERFLVDSLIHADWQLRRLRRTEAQLWSREITSSRKSSFGLDESAPLGQIFDRGPSSFMLLQRRLDATERSYYRALKQLQRLQAARPKPVAGPELASFRPPGAPEPVPNLASFRTIPFPAGNPDKGSPPAAVDSVT